MAALAAAIVLTGTAFAADVSKKDAALMAITQRPIRDTALSEGSGEPAWKTIPSWFLGNGSRPDLVVKLIVRARD
ncbi:hypothetical protein ACQP2E_28010 [Actinoplanes sp. CA-015351]|uniref:hypothetical protein n=1 Tax=Actinoplanes sp. CA-015351 TaxID=3239897 RepID=UPI003D9556BD